MAKKKSIKTTPSNNEVIYYLLIGSGLLQLAVFQNLWWAAICLLLSFAVDPKQGVPYPEWSTRERLQTIGQLALASFLIGIYLFQVVAN